MTLYKDIKEGLEEAIEYSERADLMKEADEELKALYTQIKTKAWIEITPESASRLASVIERLTETLKAEKEKNTRATTDSEEQDLHQSISLDRCYINGVKHGWNLGVKQDEKDFELTINLYLKGIREAKADIKVIKGE